VLRELEGVARCSAYRALGRERRRTGSAPFGSTGLFTCVIQLPSREAVLPAAPLHLLLHKRLQGRVVKLQLTDSMRLRNAGMAAVLCEFRLEWYDRWKTILVYDGPLLPSTNGTTNSVFVHAESARL